MEFYALLAGSMGSRTEEFVWQPMSNSKQVKDGLNILGDPHTVIIVTP